MIYVKSILSVIAAVFSSMLAIGMVTAFRGISEQRAVGLAAVAGGFAETFFSPVFWIVAMMLFAAIFAAGQIKNKILQTIFFWVPTIFVCTLGIGIASLAAYAVLHYRHG